MNSQDHNRYAEPESLEGRSWGVSRSALFLVSFSHESTAPRPGFGIFGLSGMVDALPGRVAQAEPAPLPHLEFRELLVEDELARRADRLVARRLKEGGITAVKRSRILTGPSIRDPENEDCRIGERAIRRHAWRRPPDRPTRRGQVARRHRLLRTKKEHLALAREEGIRKY